MSLYAPNGILVLGFVGAQQVRALTGDPSIGPGVVAPIGTIGMWPSGVAATQVWTKFGALATDDGAERDAERSSAGRASEASPAHCPARRSIKQKKREPLGSLFSFLMCEG